MSLHVFFFAKKSTKHTKLINLENCIKHVAKMHTNHMQLRELTHISKTIEIACFYATKLHTALLASHRQLLFLLWMLVFFCLLQALRTQIKKLHARSYRVHKKSHDRRKILCYVRFAVVLKLVCTVN